MGFPNSEKTLSKSGVILPLPACQSGKTFQHPLILGPLFEACGFVSFSIRQMQTNHIRLVLVVDRPIQSAWELNFMHGRTRCVEMSGAPLKIDMVHLQITQLKRNII